MLAVKTDLAAADLPESLNRLRAQIERDVPVGVNFHKQPLALEGSRESLALGNRMKALEERFRKLRILDEMGRFDEPRMWRQLGSIGGGNHFVKICLDAEGAVWIMLHSGSRNVGNMIGQCAMHMAKKVAERVDRSAVRPCRDCCNPEADPLREGVVAQVSKTENGHHLVPFFHLRCRRIPVPAVAPDSAFLTACRLRRVLVPA